MRLQCAVLVAIMLTPVLAQRGGGMSGGHGPGGPGHGSPSRPNPPGAPGWGRHGFGSHGSWRGRRQNAPPIAYFYSPYAPWSDGSGCLPSPFPTYWTDPCNSYNNAGPYSDPTYANTPVLPPPPLPQEDQPIGAFTPPLAYQPDSRIPPKPESAPAGNAKRESQPDVENDGHEGYPALIVFKAGGMYSATKYWTKKHLLYFATTQGQTLYAPLADVDRIYPPQPAKMPR